MDVFNLPLEKWNFPDDLKIDQVTPIFKACDESKIGNYRPISVLPCFSKILEKIKYNRLQMFKSKWNTLQKEFGFTDGHTDQIKNGFEKNYFTFGVFIGLP